MIDDDLSSADPLGQIADEFVEAFRQGRRPSVEEFAKRYPNHADEIREMLPALVLMEKAKSADDTSGLRRQTKVAAATPPLTQLGDYQILREVGRGGMGVVYEAQQLSLGRHVAIKVLPSHALLDPRHLRRFQREARSAAKLHHTNIVPVFGVGEQDGMHYYVMQFISGLGLDVVLDELRRLRQPRGKHVPTLGDAPGGPTNITQGLSAADLARNLLSGAVTVSGGAWKASGEREPSEQAFEIRESLPKGTDTPRSLGAHRSQSPGAYVLSSSGTQGSGSLDVSATIHLPGQTEGSTLSESGNQYWQSVARVGMQVADALAHAASQGILHRDIKPANLMLDGTGNVWVTDFGLAKADSDGDNLTHTGDVVGTLRYMAPERFNGKGDLRSDTYSLGLTLYELLTLRPAFDETDRNQLVKEVLHGAPARPRRLNPSVPRDLETVVLKAIARDPAHRYQTPAEMADDLKRVVEDRPVRARRISGAERLWRWSRRNPLPASLTAAIALVFLVGFAGVFWQWHEAETARDDEKRERKRADTARQGAETARDEAKESATLAQQAQLEADLARAAAQAEAYHALLSEVRALRAGHEPGWRDKSLADLARLAVMPTPLRDLPELRSEAAASLGTPDIRPVARIGLPGDDMGSFTFSPDGRTLLTAGRKTGLDFWDIAGRQHLASVPGQAVSGCTADRAVYLPDGKGLAVGTRDHGIVFTDSGTPRAPITQGSNQPTKLELAAHGQRIAVAWTGGAGITVHDLASGALLATFKDATNPTFAFSPDGRWLARQENFDIVLLPVASSEPRIVLGRQAGAGATAIAFSPDGTRLAAAFYTPPTASAGPAELYDLGKVVVWDVARREQLGVLRGHRERILDVAFSSDGEWIATGSLDYTARIWETRTGQNVAILSGSSSPPFRVQWSPTGEHLAVNMRNSQEIFLYKVAGRHHVQQWLTGHRFELRGVAAHPRLDRLATSGYTELMAWDLSTPRPSSVALPPNPGAVTALAYSPDGSLLATASWLGSDPREVTIRDANTGTARSRIFMPQVTWAMAFDPTGKKLASGDVAGNVVIWDVATSRPVPEFGRFATGFEIRSVIYLDQRSLLAHGKDTVFLFDPESGKERKVNLASSIIRSLAADRAIGRVVVGLQGGSLASFSLPDLTPGPRLDNAHPGSVEVLALSPDGRLLAGSSDHQVVLRDATSLEPLLAFPTWTGTVRGLTFDSRGRRLAIVGTDSDVDLWDLAALRDGLTAIGLAWDQPAPTVVPASARASDDEQLRFAVPIIRRPDGAKAPPDE
jgi:serine/threonine protein kinase/WD40 repeat protein